MTDNLTTEQENQEVSINTSKIDLQIRIFQTIAWLFVILGLIILGFTIYEFLTSNQPNKDVFTALDELGSFLSGLVGSLWSLAGLFFVYIAFLGQQKQLIYNKEELEQTRKELRGQKEQMELQNATLKQQQFENTFFQLFNTHQRFNENMKFVHSKEETATGIEALNKYYNAFLERTKQNTTIEAAFSKIEKRYNHNLSPYLNQIEQLLLLIDKSLFDDKSYYIQLTSSFIPRYGKLLLLYASISGEHSNLEHLMIKYQLVQDIDIIDEDLINKGDRTTFKNRKIL